MTGWRRTRRSASQRRRELAEKGKDLRNKINHVADMANWTADTYRRLQDGQGEGVGAD